MKKKRMCYNGNMHKRSSREGFTLVELSLSMVFIAILSIAVVLVITGAISSYRRSITLGKVDTIGSSLVRDMSTSIHQSVPNSLKAKCGDVYSASSNGLKDCVADGGKNFASVVRNANVKIAGNSISDNKATTPVFGAFCTGSYSYIWNSGYFFNNVDYAVDGIGPASLRYKGSDGVERRKENFKLLKVKDETRAVCEAAVRYDNVKKSYDENYLIKPYSAKGRDINGGGSVFDTTFTFFSEDPVEYLASSEGGDNNLALYGLTTTLSEQVEVNKNVYYYSSFILGTVQGGININVQGNYCAAPEGYNKTSENLDYCAINKFNFAALATGG